MSTKRMSSDFVNLVLYPRKYHFVKSFFDTKQVEKYLDVYLSCKEVCKHL